MSIITFIVLISFTVIAWQLTRYHFLTRSEENFKIQSTNLIHIINKQIFTYESYLNFGRSYFRSTTDINREEFKEFYENVIETHNNEYENIYFMGYVEKITDVPAFEKKIRSEQTVPPFKFNNFSVYPSSSRNERWVLNYLTNHDDNRTYFGYDVLSDENYSKDFENAAEANETTITERKVFINKDTILFIRPYYDKSKLTRTKEERRQALKGFIVMFVNPNNLFRLQSKNAEENKSLNLKIYSGNISKKELGKHTPFFSFGASTDALHRLKQDKKLTYITNQLISNRPVTLVVESYLDSEPRFMEISILDIGFAANSIILLVFFLIMSEIAFSNEPEIPGQKKSI
jgi:CHASE1-domain containing sensor protein